MTASVNESTLIYMKRLSDTPTTLGMMRFNNLQSPTGGFPRREQYSKRRSECAKPRKLKHSLLSVFALYPAANGIQSTSRKLAMCQHLETIPHRSSVDLTLTIATSACLALQQEERDV